MMIVHAKQIIVLISAAIGVLVSPSVFAQTSSCATQGNCLSVTNTNGTSGTAIFATAQAPSGTAVAGQAVSASGAGVVVSGTSTVYRGMWGALTTTTSPAIDTKLPAAVGGESRLTGAQFGVFGIVPASSTGVAVYGDAGNGASSWGAYFNGIVGAHNNIFTDQNVYAMGVLLTSDARLKTNVIDSTTGLSALLRLRPVDFSWKSKSADQGRHTGLIAQEVQKVMPELIKTRKSPSLHTSPELQDTLAVDYIGLKPNKNKAIHEQQDTIRKQDARIAVLEQEQKTLAEAMSRKTMATVVPASDIHPVLGASDMKPMAAQ